MWQWKQNIGLFSDILCLKQNAGEILEFCFCQQILSVFSFPDLSLIDSLNPMWLF